MLRVEDLAPGQHTIAFSKPGYERLTGRVKFRRASRSACAETSWRGRSRPPRTGKGSLRVFSTPEICTVQILGKTHDKTRLGAERDAPPGGGVSAWPFGGAGRWSPTS